MKKLIIIPAYNEGENLRGVIDDIKLNAPDYDYVIINDASTDNTKDFCIENGYHFLDLASNLGIGGAVQTGYQYALAKGYDIALQFDGDGQHDAKYIKSLEDNIAEANLVIGSRFIENEGFQSTSARRAGIKYISWLIKLFTKTRITDPTSGFRMCDKKIIEMFASIYPWDYPEPESSVTVLKKGYRIQEVPVEMRKRQGGKSSIGNPFKSLFYMIKVSVGIIIESRGGNKG